MKHGIHPEYRQVIFQDTASNFTMLAGSTRASTETIVWKDGQEYPLIRVDISSASHPFFTGQARSSDTTGRIEKFKRRYAKAAPAD